MPRAKKIKKRKAPLKRDLKLFEDLYEKYKKHAVFDDCGAYFLWAEKQVTKYNKANNTRFNPQEYSYKFTSWRAFKERT